MISNYTLPVIGFGAVVLVLEFFALMWLGQLIESLPTKNRSPTKTLSSPIPATRIIGVSFIVGYVISAYVATISTDTIFFIFGVVGLISMHMFMLTAVIFSFAAMNAINAKNKELNIT